MGKHGDSAGICFGVRDDKSYRAFLLFGKLRTSYWCIPYGLADRGDRRDRGKTACREACEETCYALGLPHEFYKNYFCTGKARYFKGGVFFVDLGLMSEAERNKVVARHLDNRNGNGLWDIFNRGPRHCEKEMSQIKWCEGPHLLAIADGNVPGFGHFRGDAAWKLHAMAHNTSFAEWCRSGHTNPSPAGHDNPHPAGRRVFITSHRNQNLQDGRGRVRLSGNALGWEQWTLHDVGNGKFIIKSHRNQNLQDNNGHLSLCGNALAWEQWNILDAGNGEVFIKSHRNQNLQDDNGHVRLSGNALAWEKWRICDQN